MPNGRDMAMSSAFLTPISNFIVLKTGQSNEINQVNKVM